MLRERHVSSDRAERERARAHWRSGELVRTDTQVAPAGSEIPRGTVYQERIPVAGMGGIVASTWVQRSSPDSSPYLHRSVPHGGVELVCRLGSVPQVVGPRTRARVELVAPGSTVVGLRFRPGAAVGVLGFPASELTDLVVDADALWGHGASAVGGQIAEAASPAQAGALLQGWVTGLLADTEHPDLVVAEAIRLLMPSRAREVRSVWSALEVSERNLRRRFRSAVGVGPKTLQRMLRFQGVLARAQPALSLMAAADGGLARLAAEAGYADQAHLTRECVRLSGVTPRVFLRETEQACGCGHDHRASFEALLRRPA
jgi:AraC-like DNA-binding protein